MQKHVHTYTCKYICTHISHSSHMHTHKHDPINARKHRYTIYVHRHKGTHVHILTCTQTHITNLHTHMYTHTNAYRTYMDVYTHANVHTAIPREHVYLPMCALTFLYQHACSHTDTSLLPKLPTTRYQLLAHTAHCFGLGTPLSASHSCAPHSDHQVLVSISQMWKLRHCDVM